MEAVTRKVAGGIALAAVQIVALNVIDAVRNLRAIRFQLRL